MSGGTLRPYPVSTYRQHAQSRTPPQGPPAGGTKIFTLPEGNLVTDYLLSANTERNPTTHLRGNNGRLRREGTSKANLPRGTGQPQATRAQRVTTHAFARKERGKKQRNGSIPFRRSTTIVRANAGGSNGEVGRLLEGPHSAQSGLRDGFLVLSALLDVLGSLGGGEKAELVELLRELHGHDHVRHVKDLVRHATKRAAGAGMGHYLLACRLVLIVGINSMSSIGVVF